MLPKYTTPLATTTGDSMMLPVIKDQTFLPEATAPGEAVCCGVG
jgi:hypothetical protein